MNTNILEAPDPEDMFADTRMSFGDHIEDLRAHLLRAIFCFIVGMVISVYPLGKYVMRMIVAPVEDQLYQFEKRTLIREHKIWEDRMANENRSMPPLYPDVAIDVSALAAALRGETASAPVLDGMMRGFTRLLDDLDMLPALDKEVLKQHGNYVKIPMKIMDPQVFMRDLQLMEKKVMPKRLSTMGITEAFMVYFKVSILTGLVLSSPWVFYHIWAFIAAGLYPHEKRLVNVYLPFSLLLFLTGVVICQFWVMPNAIHALLWFNEWLGFSPDLRLNEWLNFAILMPVIFGVSFQTPLVMMFVHKVGIVNVQFYRDKRRIAWFVMAVLAMLISPSPDAVSMIYLWLPMGLLYELGILLCVWQGENNTLLDWDIEEKSSELVEV